MFDGPPPPHYYEQAAMSPESPYAWTAQFMGGYSPDQGGLDPSQFANVDSYMAARVAMAADIAARYTQPAYEYPAVLSGVDTLDDPTDQETDTHEYDDYDYPADPVDYLKVRRAWVDRQIAKVATIPGHQTLWRDTTLANLVANDFVKSDDYFVRDDILEALKTWGVSDMTLLARVVSDLAHQYELCEDPVEKPKIGEVFDMLWHSYQENLARTDQVRADHATLVVPHVGVYIGPRVLQLLQYVDN